MHPNSPNFHEKEESLLAAWLLCGRAMPSREQVGMQACRGRGEREERERLQGVDSDVKKERNCPQMTMSGVVLRAYLQSPPDKSNSRGGSLRSRTLSPLTSLSISSGPAGPSRAQESYPYTKQVTRAHLHCN